MAAYLILIGGVFACATSVIFIKLSTTDPIYLSAYRLILAGLLLLPFAVRTWRIPGGPGWKSCVGHALVPGALLALHFISWIYGARLTPAANSTLIVNMVPIVMPVLLYFLVQERLSPREWLSTGFALCGILVLGWADFHVDPAYLYGDLVCFVSMLLYAGYMAFGRKNKNLPNVYVYVVPVYLIGGLACLILGVFVSLRMGIAPIGSHVSLELFCILGLAVVPTVAGHSIINWALRTLPGQTVAILNLGQFLFAGFLAWLLLSELPSPGFYPASLLVVTGALICIRRRKR